MPACGLPWASACVQCQCHRAAPPRHAAHAPRYPVPPRQLRGRAPACACAHGSAAPMAAFPERRRRKACNIPMTVPACFPFGWVCSRLERCLGRGTASAWQLGTWMLAQQKQRVTYISTVVEGHSNGKAAKHVLVKWCACSFTQERQHLQGVRPAASTSPWEASAFHQLCRCCSHTCLLDNQQNIERAAYRPKALRGGNGRVPRCPLLNRETQCRQGGYTPTQNMQQMDRGGRRGSKRMPKAVHRAGTLRRFKGTKQGASERTQPICFHSTTYIHS